MVERISKITDIRNIINNVIKKGFLQILVGNTLVKLMTFSSIIFVARILTTTELGTLASVDNIMSYILLANGLGLANSILRFCSIYDKPELKISILRYSFFVGLIIDVALIAVIILSYQFIPFPNNTQRYFFGLLILIPIFSFSFDCIQLYLRAGLFNKLFAIFCIVDAAVGAALDITFSYFGRVQGMIIGRYIGYIVTICFGIYIIKKLDIFKISPAKLDKSLKKEIIKYGFLAMLGNFSSMMMPQNEIFIVNNVLKNAVLTADYRVASLLPQQVQFVVMSIIMFVFPYFAKKSKDGKWIKSKFIQLSLYVTAGMVFCIGLAVLLSPQITWLIFGQKYMNVVPIMRISWIAFGANACIRMIAGNVLAAIGDVRFNFINNLTSLVLHIGIDYYLVTHYGIFGAAYGILIVYTLSGIASIVYLFHKCRKLEAVKAIE